MNKTILVIDDEPRLAQSLAALLRGCGYDVRAAIGGEEGLRTVRDEDFDVVITDLRMDGVDGFEILRFLSRNKPRIALIVITGHASTESAIEAIHQNVYDYIPKPFDFEFLKSSVEKVFAKLETEQLKEDLAHMLSHDIKVPLSSIIGFADFLFKEDGTPHPKAEDYRHKIISNGRKILALLDNYLTNARVEQGRLEIDPMPVDLVGTTQDVLRMMEYEFRQRHMTATMQSSTEAIVQGDEPLIFRAMGNLLNNAAKYAPEGCAIEVRIEPSEIDGQAAFLVSIANHGCTLTPEEGEHLFDRYKRGRSSRGTGGMGLGLHVVRCVAQAHGGISRCEIDHDRVEFRVLFPVAGPVITQKAEE